MKKDKKWFIDKWTKERDKTSIHEPMYYFINDFITDVKELDEPEVLSQKWIDEHATAVTYDEILDQTEIVYVDDLENLIIPKEESEVTLNSAFEKISEIYPITKEEVCRHLEKVTAYGGKVTYGEPEVLSQEWIDKNVVYVRGMGDFIEAEVIENLIVPKQEELESKIKVLIEAYKQEEDAYSNPENGWISGFIEDLKNLVEEEQKLQVSLYEENINIVLDDLKEYIKEQQSLSQNVGLAHTSSGNDTHYRQYDYVLECINEYESSDELRNLLVSKQELPVVPAWFDEWWKDVSKGPGSLLHNIDRFCDELFSSGTREMYNYISTPDNKKKLLNIIINELDYKVEEEHKYYALIKGHELITGEGIWDCRYWNLSTSDGVVFPSNRFSRDDKLLTKMSKEDWGKCGINESNADFVKVGEVK